VGRIWLKKITFSQLPNVLVFRIHRNKPYSSSEKVFNRFEFPVEEELDMSPYIYNDDSRNSPHNKYRLGGVVINSGETLSARHYYSFVRERNYSPIPSSFISDMSTCSNNQPLFTKFGCWLEYDDEKVSKKLHSDMIRTFFGGRIDGKDEENLRQQNVPEGSAYWLTKSAFLLFYERIQPVDIYTQAERDIQTNSAGIIAPSYPLLRLSQCHRISISNISQSLINKRYYNFFKEKVEEIDEYNDCVSLENIILSEEVFRALQFLLVDNKSNRKTVRPQISSKSVISHSDTLEDRQTEIIWVWLHCMFNLCIYGPKSNNYWALFQKELNTGKNKENPELFFRICEYSLSLSCDKILKGNIQESSRIKFFKLLNSILTRINSDLTDHRKIALRWLVHIYQQNIEIEMHDFVVFLNEKLESHQPFAVEACQELGLEKKDLFVEKSFLMKGMLFETVCACLKCLTNKPDVYSAILSSSFETLIHLFLESEGKKDYENFEKILVLYKNLLDKPVIGNYIFQSVYSLFLSKTSKFANMKVPELNFLWVFIFKIMKNSITVVKDEDSFVNFFVKIVEFVGNDEENIVDCLKNVKKKNEHVYTKIVVECNKKKIEIPAFFDIVIYKSLKEAVEKLKVYHSNNKCIDETYHEVQLLNTWLIKLLRSEEDFLKVFDMYVSSFNISCPLPVMFIITLQNDLKSSFEIKNDSHECVLEVKKPMSKVKPVLKIMIMSENPVKIRYFQLLSLALSVESTEEIKKDFYIYLLKYLRINSILLEKFSPLS
jgi:hypothetical protein